MENKVSFDIIPPTNFLFHFPKGKNGVAVYFNGNGIYRKFKLSAEDVLDTRAKVFTDSVTQFIELKDVEVEPQGYVYDCYTNLENKKWFTPDLNAEFKPKQFKVYFGNIYNPMGSLLYLDECGNTKGVTKIGKVEVIVATKFLQITNCKIIEP